MAIKYFQILLILMSRFILYHATKLVFNVMLKMEKNEFYGDRRLKG